MCTRTDVSARKSCFAGGGDGAWSPPTRRQPPHALPQARPGVEGGPPPTGLARFQQTPRPRRRGPTPTGRPNDEMESSRTRGPPARAASSPGGQRHVRGAQGRAPARGVLLRLQRERDGPGPGERVAGGKEEQRKEECGGPGRKSGGEARPREGAAPPAPPPSRETTGSPRGGRARGLRAPRNDAPPPDRPAGRATGDEPLARAPAPQRSRHRGRASSGPEFPSETASSPPEGPPERPPTLSPGARACPPPAASGLGLPRNPSCCPCPLPSAGLQGDVAGGQLGLQSVSVLVLPGKASMTLALAFRTGVIPVTGLEGEETQPRPPRHTRAGPEATVASQPGLWTLAVTGRRSHARRSLSVCRLRVRGRTGAASLPTLSSERH
ncbi:basic salivary proline-rich protein 1-like [Phyllostomus hastatus]|uniref:basic salivary proline-rich protein 1-like n=1 Tax=Phyllostomus hastatus TaxID=9423 RepID=UPI001E680BA9|nr:basic salivary proline-rich protein 1-like [Phyllostomus hastatus]